MSVRVGPAAWERAPVRQPAPTPTAADRAHVVDYLLVRATGVLLSVLVLGHFVVTHFVTDVSKDNSAFVSRRLSSLVWVLWDGAMLAAALGHGAIGVRVALADYATGVRRRRALGRAMVAGCSVIFAVGLVAIWRLARV